MKKYLSELIGTFVLVFCGTGAIIINQETDGAIGHIGIAITVGLIVTAMIYAFGDKSGAHFNPAVTIAFSLAGLFKVKEVAPYIISQVAGAFLATGMLKLLFPDNLNLGATLPSGTQLQSFILEIILAFILMLVILFTSQGSKEAGTMAGIAIGGTVLLEAMFAGPISGASMNPARSLAPAIISGNLDSLWIYITAPILGVAIATLVWKFIK
ncbi:MIP/aquaporin family protein [Flavobacterium sp. GT3R68]|uniref:MIP/aquaporin family protein n=1 Tax=Flavobacterium sp. GT3R68 TaxID=2594437 RepID=UPI000F8873F5|nr:aquaporin [Flavobacterium sp. GT3R68]RTY95753.1 aquaporin [Flavobacterium sp. GSN2]TRW93524.1 aquaporin [Flavobacterium sp. GT3R68]